MALVDLRTINVTSTPAYDTTWGYFSFAQSINLEYNQGGLYRAFGEFKLSGVLTPRSGTTDEEKFNSVKTQYNALAALFTACGEHEAPDDLSLAGTSSDSRCVALPSPLLNSASGTVYAQPLSLDIEETQWPLLLRYSATLKEADSIKTEVVIDAVVLKNAVITIEAKAPRLTVQKYAFANSEELFFNGWTPRSYAINGVIPTPSGFAAGSTLAVTNVKSMINNLMDGRVTVSLKTGATTVAMLTDYFIEQSSINIEKTGSSEGFPVSLTAKY